MQVNIYNWPNDFELLNLDCVTWPKTLDLSFDPSTWLFLPREKVTNILDNVEQKPKSRHLVINEITKYLDELENDFAGNVEEIEKIRKIVVLDDNHIKIWGFVHKLWICCTAKNPEKWIYDNWWYTQFTYNAAMEFAKTQSGYVPYTDEELQKLMNSIPGKTPEHQSQIAVKLLKIPYAGIIYNPPFGGNWWVGHVADIWSSSKCWDDAAHCCSIYNNENARIFFSSSSINNALSLILHKE